MSIQNLPNLYEKIFNNFINIKKCIRQSGTSELIKLSYKKN